MSKGKSTSDQVLPEAHILFTSPLFLSNNVNVKVNVWKGTLGHHRSHRRVFLMLYPCESYPLSDLSGCRAAQDSTVHNLPYHFLVLWREL